MSKPIVSEKQYVDSNGTKCIYCGDDTGVESCSDFDMESGIGRQDVCCTGCGRRWTDLYSLYGYEIDESEEEDGRED